MAMMDALLLLSDDQAVTADAASTNVIDWAVASRDMGPGEQLGVGITITQAFDNLTNINFELQADTVENFASATELTAQLLTLAQLTLGRKIFIAIPPSFAAAGGERYLRMNYDITGTTPTVGTIHAAVIPRQEFAHQYRAQSYSGL